MCDTHSKPEEKYQTIKRKSVTKSNEKLRAETNCENGYETLYLTDSGDVNINTSSTDDEFCFDKKKRMRKRKQCTPKLQHNQNLTKTYLGAINSLIPTVILSATTKICFQQTRNTFEKIGASYSNKQKPKNVVIFTDSMLKSLRMKESNKNLNDNDNPINGTSLNPLLKIKDLKLSNLNRVTIDNLNIN